MNPALADKLDTTRKESAVCLGSNSLLDGLPHAVGNLGMESASIDSHGQACPTDNIGMQLREIRYLTILDCHEVGALGAGLSDMPAL